jgi:hypothetical protein
MSTREKKDSDLFPCGTERIVTLSPDPCSSVAPDTAAPEEKFSSEDRASLHFTFCVSFYLRRHHGDHIQRILLHLCLSTPTPSTSATGISLQVRPLIPRYASGESPICTPRLVPAGRCSWVTTGDRELHRPSFESAYSRGLHRAGHSSWQASCRRWDGGRDAMCLCDWWSPVSAQPQ